MPSFVRAFFECDDDPVDNLVLDLVMSNDRKWVEEVRTAGWWGQLSTKDIWPLLLLPDGIIDFGTITRAEPETEPRYGSINLPGRLLVVGESFQLEFGWERRLTLTSIKNVLSLLPD